MVTQHAGDPFDDALGCVRTGLIEALCQDCAGHSTVTVPADEVDFADTAPEALEKARRGSRPESCSLLRASTETDKEKEERSSRAHCPDALDIEEMTKGLFGVDVPGTTLKGNDAEGINRGRFVPFMESALSKQARIPQQRLKCHSTALIACTSREIRELGAEQCANRPPLRRTVAPA